MSRGQRLTFLGIAVIIAVVAVIVLSGGDGQTERAADPARSATASATSESATATPTPTPAPKPKPPLLQAGKQRSLRFDEGDTVRFRVRHDQAEEVHVHGYDITRELEPNQTATVSFEASITGIFEIELEHSGTLLAQMKVEP